MFSSECALQDHSRARHQRHQALVSKCHECSCEFARRRDAKLHLRLVMAPESMPLQKYRQVLSQARSRVLSLPHVRVWVPPFWLHFDPLPSKLLSYCLPSIVPLFTKLTNMSLAEGGDANIPEKGPCSPTHQEAVPIDRGMHAEELQTGQQPASPLHSHWEGGWGTAL